MVRQEYLESLVEADTAESTLEAKAVVRFINELTSSLRESLQAQLDHSRNPAPETDVNAYMEMSAELDEPAGVEH